MSLPPTANTRKSRISWVWLIPVVAAIVAGFLAWRTLREQGPDVTLDFRGGEGISAGQTKVRYKAVDLGTVESVRLANDASHVVVHVRMRSEAERFLTENARFWVVRPRLSSGSLAGIETIVSGSYIEMDPGQPGGAEKYAFDGLETPPAVRSGEPGTTFKLNAERLGSLGPGAPVFFRDVTVGEVLDYNIGDGRGPVTLNVFVRSPYDKLVSQASQFWNASGISVQLGGSGLHVEIASLQAVLNGGVAYDTTDDPKAQPASGGAEFHLFSNYEEAKSAGYRTQQPFVTYFESSVSGLTKGAAVDFFGLQIGVVTAVELDFDPATARSRVRVRFTIQPERIGKKGNETAQDPVEVARRLVALGVRAQLQTSSYLTGSMVLAMAFDKTAPKAEVTRDGDDWVIPSDQGGGINAILSSVSNIANKIDRLPVDEIGANLNNTLRSASSAMASVGDLANHANAGLSPAMARLPAITASLEAAVTHADRVFTSFDRSYGKDSDIQQELARAMVQVGDTARSIRLLADFLDRHPEALVRGRTGYSSQ